jgi:uncharacterized membrane protein
VKGRRQLDGSDDSLPISASGHHFGRDRWCELEGVCGLRESIGGAKKADEDWARCENLRQICPAPYCGGAVTCGSTVIVLYVMLGGILAARAAGMLGVAALDSWVISTRVGLALMFLFTGLAHFNRTRQDLVRMVPPSLPNPGLLVTLTGIAEFAGAIGLLIAPLARLSAWALAALLVAMFPANVYASRRQHTIAGRPHTPMGIRAPLQVLWIGLLIWTAR